jgi:5-methylcytosine-specific restriction endonuclease McrA
MPPFKTRRRLVFERDDYRCGYCRLTVCDNLPEGHPRRATVDHVIPCSKGGRSGLDNLLTACQRCNGEKGDMSAEVFRWYRHMILRGHNRDELLEAIAALEPDLLAASYLIVEQSTA